MKNDFREILNNRNWDAEAPASEEAIEQLLQRSKLPLPADYLNFLRYSIENPRATTNFSSTP
jgi:hypothetical protein